jgi:hypothetical protein
MTHQEEAVATDRLRRALLAFEDAQRHLMVFKRRFSQQSAEDMERLEQHAVVAATQLVEAFTAFSAAGLTAAAEDRRRVNEAERVLAEARA